MHADERQTRAPSDHSVFDTAVVGIDERESALDALALTKQLVSEDGEAWLVYVELVDDEPWASNAAWGADMRAFALKRLGTLREEARVAGEVACVEARSIRRGLHQFAVSHGANLLVVGTSRRDDLTGALLGDGTRGCWRIHPVRSPSHQPRIPCAQARSARPRSPTTALAGASERSRWPEGSQLSAAPPFPAFKAVKASCHAHGIWNGDEEIEQDVGWARSGITSLGGVEPQAELAEHTAEALTRYAASVDLLVIGPQHYAPINRCLQQTASQRLAAEPTCPLLVLPTAGRRSQRATL